MISNKVYTVIVILMTSMLFGCSNYHVWVDAYTGHERIEKGAKIYVPADGHVEMIEMEFVSMLKYMLQENGMVVTSHINDADYYIRYSFGIGDPRQVQRPMLLWEGGDAVAISDNRGNRIRVQEEPRLRSTTQTQTMYNRFLILSVEVNDGLMPDRRVSKWYVETQSVGPGTDLRRVLPYLLYATFDEFGMSTGFSKRKNVPVYDPNVSRIVRNHQNNR